MHFLLLFRCLLAPQSIWKYFMHYISQPTFSQICTTCKLRRPKLQLRRSRRAVAQSGKLSIHPGRFPVACRPLVYLSRPPSATAARQGRCHANSHRAIRDLVKISHNPWRGNLNASCVHTLAHPPAFSHSPSFYTCTCQHYFSYDKIHTWGITVCVVRMLSLSQISICRRSAENNNPTPLAQIHPCASALSFFFVRTFRSWTPLYVVSIIFFTWLYSKFSRLRLFT